MINQSHTVLPVGLLAAGRPCLVVGGGKIALRKTRSLLDAGATVTVISPALDHDLKAMADEGVIRYIPRLFTREDVRGNFLVLASTSDVNVNKSILEACREYGILGGSVDRTWVQSDFVSPATFRQGDLTVSISTGGKSCRRSKLVKDSLARHVQMVDTAQPLIIGASHNELSVGEREPFHLVGPRLEETAAMIMQVWGVHEFMLLNTCNRVELIAIVTRATAVEAILKRILGFDQLGEQGYYVKRGREAFDHLPVLTAGLLSQTPGENHIVAQFKEAAKTAATKGWAAGMISQWLASALHIAKDIRRDTADLLRHEEIEDLCLQYLAAEIPDWPTRRVMVIGTGMIGACLVEQLAKEGHPLIWCYHKRRPELPAAGAGQVELCDLTRLPEHLAKVNAIVCATSGADHVLHAGHTASFNQSDDTIIVDLAMPRNVAPELHGHAGRLRVVDLDDLKHWYRRELADMTRIFEVSRNLLANHQDLYEKLIESFQGRNTQQ